MPAAVRLFERLAHDLGGDAGHLDVHLQRGDARRRAGHLEVHVAVVIFGAGDVRQDGVLARLLVHDEAHGDAGHRRAQRHAGIHHRQRAAADRRHRRRPVRLEDVRHDANRVGERFFRRKHRQQRALGERAVTDFAAAGAAHELHFADRERREVVVQHEPAVGLALDRFDLLLVVRRAERHGDERLRFAAREHGRAVRTRGSTPTSDQMGRISSNLRPSSRTPLLEHFARAALSPSAP